MPQSARKMCLILPVLLCAAVSGCRHTCPHHHCSHPVVLETASRTNQSTTSRDDEYSNLPPLTRGGHRGGDSRATHNGTESRPGTPDPILDAFEISRVDAPEDKPVSETKAIHPHPAEIAETAPFLPPAACGCRPVLSWKRDRRVFWHRLKDDAKGTVNWNNALILSAALGTSLAIREDLDAEVRANTARHPQRWGKASDRLGTIGDVGVQVPALLGMYAYSLHRQDEELHELSGTLISAFTITGLSTVVIKGIANTDRPSDDFNGGQFGFPSYHASSNFALAAVLDEYYGPRAGLPAYAAAGVISWSRIDERDHDLSDVVFGAALGYVIGKSVAGRRLHGDSRVRLLPYVHPIDGSSGLLLEIPY